MLEMGSQDAEEAAPQAPGTVEWEDWAPHTIDLRRAGIGKPPEWGAQLRLPDGHPSIQDSTELDFFDLCFPRKYFQTVVIPATRLVYTAVLFLSWSSRTECDEHDGLLQAWQIGRNGQTACTPRLPQGACLAAA